MKRHTRILLAALMLSAMLVLSGCVDIIYQVRVDEDGSGGVRVIAAYNREQLQSILQSSAEPTSTTLLTDELRAKAAASGLKVDEVEAGAQSGVRVTGSFASPEELPKTLDKIEQLFLSMDIAETLTGLGVVPSLDGTLTVDRGLLNTKYSLALGSGQKVEDPTLAAFQEMMPTKINYAAVARMPGKTVSTNGRYQPSDRSLAWPADATTETAGDYTVVSQAVNGKSIAILGAVGVLALAVAVFFAVRSRRGKARDSASPPSPAKAVPTKGKKR